MDAGNIGKTFKVTTPEGTFHGRLMAGSWVNDHPTNYYFINMQTGMRINLPPDHIQMIEEDQGLTSPLVINSWEADILAKALTSYAAGLNAWMTPGLQSLKSELEQLAASLRS